MSPAEAGRDRPQPPRIAPEYPTPATATPPTPERGRAAESLPFFQHREPGLPAIRPRPRLRRIVRRRCAGFPRSRDWSPLRTDERTSHPGGARVTANRCSGCWRRFRRTPDQPRICRDCSRHWTHLRAGARDISHPDGARVAVSRCRWCSLRFRCVPAPASLCEYGNTCRLCFRDFRRAGRAAPE